jgi:lipopolysaccharide biosynthesis glycosyltransferase
MSTGHAIARFFVPMYCNYEGWALFTDGDVLFRDDVEHLMQYADPKYAVCVVKHPPMPEQAIKKDGHIQTMYARKNWSSVMLFHCAHPANQTLWTTALNQWPGRDLHAFKWLQDEQIGELPAGWNYLVGVTDPVPPHVSLAHFTLGTPDVIGHEEDPFAGEWRDAAKRAGYKHVVPA